MIHRKEKKGWQVLRYRKLTKLERELSKVFCLTRRLDGSVKFSKGFPSWNSSFPKNFFDGAAGHFKVLVDPAIAEHLLHLTSAPIPSKDVNADVSYEDRMKKRAG